MLAASMLALGVWMGYTFYTGRRIATTPTATYTPSILEGRVASQGYNASKLDYTLSLVDEVYIDPLNTDTIVDNLMHELMAQLDPHSAYIPAEDMQAFNEPLEGEFDGIGVVFNMLTDTIVVLNTVAGGPSYKAGIMPGDRIITVDGDTVAGRMMNQDKVVERLRGPRGTKVKVGVMRGGTDDIFDVEITRGKIPLKSIDAAFMIRPEVGYIRLTNFARTTHREFLEAVATLRKEGMKSLIFDLRSNSGGYLDQAILMTNEFLPKDNLIVYTEDRWGNQQRQYSTGGGRVTDIPLVVLIDDYSASSSEILAGALQDNDRGTIVGRRSFGKGLVQSQIPLNDGSAIRLTIARYYTPTGRSIQKPYVRGGDNYEGELMERYEHGEFFSADSVHFADSLKFVTPKGKVVYGGGGIMPDVFVPIDTLNMTPYYYAATGLNILYRYALNYTDQHREKINAVTTIDQLNALLDSDKSLLEGFVEYAASIGLEPNWGEINTSRELLTSLLRAYIGRNTALEDTGYFSQIIPIDEALLKAFELLE